MRPGGSSVGEAQPSERIPLLSSSLSTRRTRGEKAGELRLNRQESEKWNLDSRPAWKFLHFPSVPVVNRCRFSQAHVSITRTVPSEGTRPLTFEPAVDESGSLD